MKTLKRIEIYKSTAEKVFKCLDDLGVTGMHMTKSSMPMMGGKLNLDFLTEHHTGLGSKYRWTGKVVGMIMDFTVEVTKWINGKEKIWGTIGAPKLILYAWFKMQLIVSPSPNGTQAELFISYEKPSGWFYRLLSFFLADWYCVWCLKNMLGDCKKSLEGES
ncbi:MAG: hypothetical protein HYR67_02140 [Bacteroidetes bacterium]|nr:hypothetical protein [Bacteroidota bacterium]